MLKTFFNGVIMAIRFVQKLLAVVLALSSTTTLWAQSDPAQPLPTKPNHAEVHLQTDLNHLAVSVGQGAPLPPGGCTPGYSWNTTFGGCRRAQTETESAACTSGYIGTRTRTRPAYPLQANPSDIGYGDWSAWNTSACKPPYPAKGTLLRTDYDPGNCGVDPVTHYVYADGKGGTYTVSVTGSSSGCS